MAAHRFHHSAEDVPGIAPVFPLSGALLLPRAELPLNVFEPRYLAMVDDALAGERIIVMVQPDESKPGNERGPQLFQVGCLGRLTQFAETGDGRYLITLTGICRVRIGEEVASETPYRQFHIDAMPYGDDFEDGRGEEGVDRSALLTALASFLEANKLEADWDGIQQAGTETLVNALSCMSPYGALEKQALLEAKDLKQRSEILIAITQMMLARMPGGDDGEPSIQ